MHITLKILEIDKIISIDRRESNSYHELYKCKGKFLTRYKLTLKEK